jgi:hypothetical protein
VPLFSYDTLRFRYVFARLPFFSRRGHLFLLMNKNGEIPVNIGSRLFA